MTKKYVVTRTAAPHAALQARRNQPRTARQRNRIDLLLRTADGDTDAASAEDLGVTTNTVARVRQRYAAGGLDAALSEQPRRGAPPQRDGKQEALILARACSPAPAGEVRWSVRRLTQRGVGREIAQTVSRATIRRLLQKTSSSRGRSRRGADPTG